MRPRPGQPESDNPYRGFAEVGRCGTGKARPGEKGDGKTRYFLSEGCAVPGREARSMFGTANTIGEVGCRMARSLQIYVRSGAPDFGIANTIEDLGHRIAPRPQIYVKSETSVLGMANTIGEAGRPVAQGAQIAGKMGSAGPVSALGRSPRGGAGAAETDTGNRNARMHLERCFWQNVVPCLGAVAKGGR